MKFKPDKLTAFHLNSVRDEPQRKTIHENKIIKNENQAFTGFKYLEKPTILYNTSTIINIVAIYQVKEIAMS